MPGFYDKARRNAAAALRDYGDPAAADAVPRTCTYNFGRIIWDWLP